MARQMLSTGFSGIANEALEILFSPPRLGASFSSCRARMFSASREALSVGWLQPRPRHSCFPGPAPLAGARCGLAACDGSRSGDRMLACIRSLPRARQQLSPCRPCLQGSAPLASAWGVPAARWGSRISGSLYGLWSNPHHSHRKLAPRPRHSCFQGPAPLAGAWCGLVGREGSRSGDRMLFAVSSLPHARQLL